MIVISDGDPAPPPPELIQDCLAQKISVSMVAIFPHGNAEPPTMRAVAEATKGRYYFPQDPNTLPSIFIKEAKTLKRSQIQNVRFTPEAKFPSPIMKGIDSLPPLKGYTLTTPKPRALTILEGPDPEEEDPVLAVWRYGVGTSAAWTSDLSPNWGAAWVEWPKYRAFVEQLFENIARAQDRSQIRLRVDSGGNVGILTVEDHAPTPGFLAVAARVATPEGKRIDVELPQVAPGRYSAQFPLAGIGRYQVAVSAIGAGDATDGGTAERKERAFGSLVVPYSAEYLRFRANPLVLRRIAERTGGRELTGGEDGLALFGAGRQPRLSSRPIFDWLLAALALLLLLDVGLRRVQVDPAAVLRALIGRFRGGKAESTATMGALLTRKQAVSLPKADKPPAPIQLAPRPPGATAPPPSAKPAPPPSAKPGTPPSGDGTTSKLLEAKRRRQQEPKPPDTKP